MSLAHLFDNISTSSISDALDGAGLPGSCLGIAPLARGMRMAGEAYTVRYQPSPRYAASAIGDYVDAVPSKAVVAIDNGARLDCSVWGDILSSLAVSRRFAGTVIDGVCRDAEKTISLNYPMFSRGKFMRTGAYRIELAEICGTVSIGGVRILAGDMIVADDDGVVAIPRAEVQRIAEESRRIEERDAHIIRCIGEGMNLVDSKAARAR